MGNSISQEEKSYNYIYQKIINGEYNPGMRVQERKISEELNMSRTPVRGAIRRLASENLINIIPNKGAQVVKITRKKLLETLQIRSMLERLAAGQAAEQMSRKKAKELENIFKKMEEYINNTEEVNQKGTREYELLNHKFHKLIIKESKNEVLFEIYSYLENFLLLCKIHSVFRKHSLAEHRAIKDAILAGDRELAQKASYEHTMSIYNSVTIVPGE